MINKYIKIHFKWIAQFAFVCATIAFVPLFVVSLCYDYVKEDILVSFVPYLIAVVWVAIASLFTIRFKKMIEKQERLYKVKFQDTDAVKLEKTLYLSKDWLIKAGTYAVYKEHIKTISFRRSQGRGAPTNSIIIETVDNKAYTIWGFSSATVRKIKNWKKSYT